MKRSFPPQKGNISAYPFNNNIQRDSLASDPEKEKRLRTPGNIYTHPSAGKTAGLGCVIPNTELKEWKHQLCGIFGEQTGPERRQRKAFNKSPCFMSQSTWNVRLLPGEAGICDSAGGAPSRLLSPAGPRSKEKVMAGVASCGCTRPFGCSRKMPPWVK